MGGKTSTISTSEQRILSLQVQQSSQGVTLPVVYGRTRVPGNLVWYGDFAAIEHKTITRQGGKGGGGVRQVDIQYTYEAAVMMALCEGEIKGIVNVWRDKEKFAGLAPLRLNLASGSRNQPVWSHLQQEKHQAQAISYSDTAYVYSPNYELTKSAQIYNHNFEVDGKLGYSDTIVDANPADILVDLLTNQNYGCGFPAENMGNTEVYSTYCRAAGIFLSPAYKEQTEAHQNITDLLEQTNSAAVFSQGRLNIVPYGDAQLAGNGAVYVPNLTPLYDLDDDDFLVGDAEDPVRKARKTGADAYNRVEIEYLDRANDYNIAVMPAEDQANIEQYGLRPKEAVQMHAICDKAVAQQVAQLTLQRALYVRNEYEFRLGWKYCLLEPMDLVTLTDTGLGLEKTPVRIIEIEEDADGTLTVRAEDFPFGIASATSYPTQPALGYSANYNVAPGNAHAPVMFEAPLQLTGNEPQIWLATAGGENWGGAEVWVSTDGDSYVRVGNLDHKARYGSLQAALPEGAVYDNVNTLQVAVGAGQLQAATEAEARDMLTACYADGEFLAYETAELTGVGRYTLGKLVRGAWGSNIARHEAGTPFVRLDDALFRYTFDKAWLGKTVWVKLVSYNVFGSALQELAEVPAYSYTIVGAPLGQVANLRLTSAWAYGRNASVAWDKLDGADSYDVEVFAANNQARLRLIEGVVGNRYTYTLADMKADGGQVRDVVFRVRGRAVTGKTGAWAQVVAQNPQLQALQGIELDSGLKQVVFKCAAPTEEDFAGVVLWLDDTPACPAIEANLIYDGQDTFVVLTKCKGEPLEGGKTYYLRAAGYDSFDKQNLNISSSHAFTVYEVNAIAKELGESNLQAALNGRLDLIDGNGAGSMNQRLLQSEQKAANELLLEAQRIGAKVSAVENVNAQQAQQIATVTASQGDLAAALQTEKQARISGDQAEATARQALAAQHGQTAALVTALQQTVANNQQSSATQIEQMRAALNDPDNLCRNPSMRENTAGWLRMQREQADGQWVGLARQRDQFSDFWVTVNPGDVIYCAMWVKNKGDDYSIGIGIHTQAQTGGDSWIIPRRADKTVAGWQKVENFITVPANAVWMRLIVQVPKAHTVTSPGWHVRDIEWRKVNALSPVTADIGTLRQTLADQQQAVAQQATTLRAEITAAKAEMKTVEDGVLDLRQLDADTYYPCVSYPMLPAVVARLRIYANFSDTQNTVWGTHRTKSFVLMLDWEANGITWGVNYLRRVVHAFEHKFAGQSPVLGIHQMDRSSREVVWLRGGALYRYQTERGRGFTLHATGYTEHGQTVSPRTYDANALPQTNEAKLSAGITETRQAIATVDGKVQSMYTMQVDANGHIAAFGLSSEVQNGTATGKAIFNVDAFGIGSTGKTTRYPFTVDTNSDTVGINGALVVNGKAIIDKLNAGDIDGNKIAAHSITANHLQARAVTADKIAAKSITGDKIAANQEIVAPLVTGGILSGAVIQGGSANFGNGQCTITSAGYLTAQNANITGHITANSGVFRGRIEANEGFFNGTVRADKILGNIITVRNLKGETQEKILLADTGYHSTFTSIILSLQAWIDPQQDMHSFRRYFLPLNFLVDGKQHKQIILPMTFGPPWRDRLKSAYVDFANYDYTFTGQRLELQIGQAYDDRGNHHVQWWYANPPVFKNGSVCITLPSQST
ncbi:MAG: phage tail protein [Eikenella sp.]|nr:phage tail protein [Eikenella sp.]